MGLSKPRVWQITSADRKMVRYRSRRPPEVEQREMLRDLANERRRIGYRQHCRGATSNGQAEGQINGLSVQCMAVLARSCSEHARCRSTKIANTQSEEEPLNVRSEMVIIQIYLPKPNDLRQVPP
ncbi:hypothetical protein BN406_04011 (plasmid) [Sinorhizobium meliloti Rm41]|nr:hypothetical protein BN406_04011 [Sinorhizobium meliloti Rm41]